MADAALCSLCFRDRGLQMEADQVGVSDTSVCPNCRNTAGTKLDLRAVAAVAHRFFVWGTLSRCDYGAAPLVQFNPNQSTNITAAPWLDHDIRVLEKTLGVGFFYYGPRLWMVGEVGPLIGLQDPALQSSIIHRIIAEYPTVSLTSTNVFYRVRRNPKKPEHEKEYDTPPSQFVGTGRLDSPECPAMYASQDLAVCVHECRVTAEDEAYVATMSPTRNLKLLDLAVLLNEQGVTEFESLDMAVHMLFLAGNHSYMIAREIAREAYSAGHDGLVYPSYFSLLRTGGMPFETVYGISDRRIPHLQQHEATKIVSNLAVFGRPIEDGRVSVQCINRIILRRVEYLFHFGPVGCEAGAYATE